MDSPTPSIVPIAGMSPDEILPGELTFGQLLFAVSGADQELLERIDVEKLVPALMSKTDSCRYIIDKCDDTAARLRAYRDEFSAAIQVVEGVSDRIEKRMAFLMAESGVTKIDGFRHSVRLQKNGKPSLTISPAFEKPGADLYRKHPELIRRTYSWDKDALLKAIEGGAPLTEIAVVNRGHHIRWSANKGGLT